MLKLEASFADPNQRCQFKFESHAKLVADAEAKFVATGALGGAVTTKSASAKLATKDVKVGKQTESASQADFRKWQKTIEYQLDHVFGKMHIEDLILGICKINAPITERVWSEFIGTIHLAEPHMFLPRDWQFGADAQWMYSCMACKLNTVLAEVCSSIQDQLAHAID